MNNKWYNSDWATWVGQGIMWFLIAVDIGTCSMLGHSKFEYKPKEELVEKIVDRIPKQIEK